MTATTIATLTTTATVEQRRKALIEYADLVHSEDQHNRGPLTAVIGLVVSALASHRVTTEYAVGAFNQLVGAVGELAAFTADEAGWLTEHEYRVSVEARANAEEALRADVDYWADRIVGGE